MTVKGGLLVAVAAGLAMAACNALWGLDQLDYRTGAGGAAGGGAAGGGAAGGGAAGGNGGQGGVQTGPCADVTCSDHGVCVEAAGQAWCQCLRGYLAEGTECVVDPNAPTGDAWFVALDGDDGGAGTMDDPFLTIRHALEKVQPGDTVYLREGVHQVTDQIRVQTHGTASAPNALWGYPGEAAIIEFSSGANPCTNPEPGLVLEANWWHVKRLTVRNSCQFGFLVLGGETVIDHCVAHDCGATGFQVMGTAAQTKIVNCDAYRNYDPQTQGQGADGFAAEFDDLGPGTAFVGCRAWNNSDDGFDLWEANQPVLVDHCWAFENGIDLWDNPNFDGDGNGFKLGRSDPNVVPQGRHLVVGSVAFGHPNIGFDENSNDAGLVVLNNTAWNNGAYNFRFDYPQTPTAPHVLRNNLSFDGAVLVNSAATTSSNSWALPGITVDAADFLSLDPSLARVDRLPDGSLPQTGLLRLVEGSDCIDAGEILTEVQRPHNGAAPDLGAFEHP